MTVSTAQWHRVSSQDAIVHTAGEGLLTHGIPAGFFLHAQQDSCSEFTNRLEFMSGSVGPARSCTVVRSRQAPEHALCLPAKV